MERVLNIFGSHSFGHVPVHFGNNGYAELSQPKSVELLIFWNTIDTSVLILLVLPILLVHATTLLVRAPYISREWMSVCSVVFLANAVNRYCNITGTRGRKKRCVRRAMAVSVY